MANPILILRIAETILAFIVLICTSYFIGHFRDRSDPANFLLFDSIWTFLALGYLMATPVFMPNLYHPSAFLAIEAVTMLFWFAGFIALAVSLKITVCLSVPGQNCSSMDAAKAAVAFGAFSWVAWCATLGLVINALWQEKKGVDPEATE